MAKKRERIPTIYICYDGLLPPLGQSQVLEYLRELGATGDYELTLVSFERQADLDDTKTRELCERRLAERGVRWIALRYHRYPTGIATAYDLVAGFAVCAWLCWTGGARLVHARSQIPATMGLALKWFFGTALIYDMRGLWADERVDTGSLTKTSPLYRAAKWVEGLLLRRADVVVSLTRAAVREMRTWPSLRGREVRFEVISTCANLETFSPRPRPPGAPMTIGYVGSTLGWYLFEPVVECFKAVRELHPNARMLILNRDNREALAARFEKAGVPRECVEIKSVGHAEVAVEMARMDATFFFITPAYSKVASAPTKLGEFLGCGVPCLTNTGVGDQAEILEAERVGVTVSAFDAATVRGAVPRLLELARERGARERCVAAAQRHFSLVEGSRAYHRIYQSLL